MASYSIRFARSVRKDFKKIPAKDAKRILARIAKLAEDPRPADAKKLTNDGALRIRIGTYRVIYDVIDNQLLILVLKVGHRKDIYKK